jgi:aspartyl-tRNA(Asn)/glutamyl-tRNA(Gln) amidotransferase subunit A
MDSDSLLELASKLQSKEVSSLELTQHYLDRIAHLNPDLNAFTCVDDDGAIQAAKQSDQRRASDQTFGPMDGIPISIKDILCTKRLPTTCGSEMLRNYVSPFDAFVVERLHASGMVILGKTNLDEFAMGGSTETSCFGPSRNPWDRTRTCGGSSGGSAAAVAVGLSPVSIGTDTGGSIRQPAAFCGVCGLKPTYGRVSRYGLVAYASSLDQAGPFGRTIDDLAMVLTAIAGHDPQDSTSLCVPSINFAAATNDATRRFRIGFVREHLEHPGLDPEIRKSLEQVIEIYRKLGNEIIELSLPHHKYAVPTYYIVAPCEASSNLSRYDGAHYGFRSPSTGDRREPVLVEMYKQTRSQGFGAEVKRRIMLGTFALSAGYSDKYYLKALQVRRLIRNDYDRAFESVDAILGPTTPSTPFRLGEKVNDPLQMYLEDLYTVSANLAGVPGLSMPIGFHSSGLPIGAQLQAAPLAEEKLLAIAKSYHREVDYKPQLAPG